MTPVSSNAAQGVKIRNWIVTITFLRTCAAGMMFIKYLENELKKEIKRRA